MRKNVTRLRVLQIWFTAVALLGAAVAVFGGAATVGTWLVLLAVSLVPPAIVLMLWPTIEPLTASDVLHGTDRSHGR